MVGAFISTDHVAPLDQAITAFVGFTNRPLLARRDYFAPSIFTVPIPAKLLADGEAGRLICLTLRPAFNPVNSTDLTELDAFLAACKAAGLRMKIALWHEPYYSHLTAAQFIAMVKYYGPTVRKYYPLVFVTANHTVTVNNENSYYPGDTEVDEIATDFYAHGYTLGDRLDIAASIADNASPRKPFGLWEFNGCPDLTAGGQTQAEITEYFGYTQGFFTGRRIAGKLNGDLLFFNSDGPSGPGNTTREIISATDFRIPLYQSLYDSSEMISTFTAKVTDATTGEVGSKTASFAVNAPVAPTALFGASLGPVQPDNAYVQTWITKVGRPLAVRHYFASGAIWGSYAASPFDGEARLRRILCDFELARDGSDKVAFDAFLGSAAQAGLDMDITIWHAAPSKGFASPSAYFTALKPYVPIVYKHGFRHVYDLTGYQIVHDGNLAPWWPGNDVQVSAVGVEYYGTGWLTGQRMDATSSFCTSKNVGFGLAEFGMNFKTTAGGDMTEQNGLDMLKHVYNIYSAKITAGNPIYDVVLWSNITGNTAPGYQIQNQPASWITGKTVNGIWYPGYRQLADLIS